ncbi:alpha/beta hydrolase [Roseovarius sp. ZX-A-9]|uniref:alpha/beta hydrolase n=1 Tax=Roseovarius sp. ZX-A-9 TaxID=3014783 RepID=UPI00232EB386|nr:alpha/beta hydrolase [Roseovarius sp. ZX-A-9]
MTRTIPVDPTLEHGYDVRLLRSDFAELSQSWAERSAALRKNATVKLDRRYGPGEKDLMDLFLCGEKEAPLFVFIHGGYWQRGDKAMYSFVAESFLKAGVDVAIVGYELCPSATMASMAGKIRSALVWLWQNGAAEGINKDRINVSGHSAGGHLTGIALATDWPSFNLDVPKNLIKSGIPISGLFQLEPLLRTTISDALHLDESKAKALSPQFLPPATTAPILVTLGGGETPQFHWQADEFVAQWSTFEAPIEKYAEPDVDHFDVVNRLSSSESEIFRKTLAWLR